MTDLHRPLVLNVFHSIRTTVVRPGSGAFARRASEGIQIEANGEVLGKLCHRRRVKIEAPGRESRRIQAWLCRRASSGCIPRPARKSCFLVPRASEVFSIDLIDTNQLANIRA